MNTCTLPEELLIQILQRLSLGDLINCSKACRLLHRTIKHAVILQYNIQLAIAGMQDCGSASPLPVAERLAEVRIQQESWSNLRFRARYLFLVPQYCRVWELSGGILAHGLSQGITTRGLAFIKFPSISRGVLGCVWQHPDLGVKIRNFTFDPAQDLVAIIAAKPTGVPHNAWDRELYCLSMSSGEIHPRAASVPLACVLNRDTDKDGDFVIQIMADFIAVLFRARDAYCKDQLFIWDWKSGRLVTNLTFPGTYQMDAFAFLSPRCFLVSKIERTPLVTDPPELQVYDFLDTDPLWPTTPRLVRSFQLPQLVANATVGAMTVRSDPAPRNCSPLSQLEGAPFRTGPLSQLLVISIVIFHRATEATDGEYIRSPFQLFVNASTLLEDSFCKAPILTGTVVPWEAWGPKHTRMLRSIPTEFAWVCYVHGTRYVTLDRRGPEPRQSRLRMLDFNPLLVKRAQYPKDNCTAKVSDTYESDDLYESAFSTPLRLPRFHIVSASEPTIIRGGWGFRDDVKTHLPYRDICSSELFDYRAVMIDEECMVGIHTPLVEGRRMVEVLSF